MEIKNPKELNLEKLLTEKNKITLGFKCSPNLKLKLAQEAQKINITLSEYVESIVEAHDNEKNQLADKTKEVEFYENDILKTLFTQNKGKSFDYTNSKGQKDNITIKSIQDVYTILIHSFKISKT
jgi:hypothetical protein